MEFLVGYTGFVGSNIVAKHTFDGLYHSKKHNRSIRKKSGFARIFRCSGRDVFGKSKSRGR